MGVRVSLQLPGSGQIGPAGHIASGALRENDLVLFPNVGASLLQHEGPYIAVLVEQFGDAPSPWETPDEEPFPDLPAGPDESPVVLEADAASFERRIGGVVSVQCIRCSCEEAHSLGGDTFQVAFRLEQPYTGDRRPINVTTLLNTPQDAVWPEAADVLTALTSAPSEILSLAVASKTVLHLAAPLRSSWCRIVPWC